MLCLYGVASHWNAVQGDNELMYILIIAVASERRYRENSGHASFNSTGLPRFAFPLVSRGTTPHCATALRIAKMEVETESWFLRETTFPHNTILGFCVHHGQPGSRASPLNGACCSASLARVRIRRYHEEHTRSSLTRPDRAR